jgi:hypothetical protein
MKGWMRSLCMVSVCSLMVACDSGSDGGSEIDAAELPDASRSFLSRILPGVDIRFAERDGDGFDVVMANGVEVDFDAAGNWVEVDGRGNPLPASALRAAPSSAVSYAQRNFDSPITEIEREPYGFDLYLASGVELEFGPSGNFLRVD